MANRISGITIEIEGNTTKLSKALQGVNKDLKSTQSALKDVDKLLKLDPGNTDLLQQKQKLLAKAIEDTKKKLDKEKEALAQLASQDQTPKVTAQMDALQRQIVADEQSLKSLEKESGSFGSVAQQKFAAVGEAVKKVGEKISEVGDKIKGFGENLTKKVTAPIVAVGGASLAAFNEVDSGLDTIIKKTGATGEAAEQMGEILENIATSIPTDFETAGNAIGEVSTRFGVTGDKLEALSSLFIKFADINGTDVVTAVDSTQKALAAFGLGAENAEHLLDMMNATGQRTGVSVDTLASGLVSNAASFSELGLNIFQATEFMGDLETSGADSSAVLGGLAKALKNATAEGKPLDEALAELQSAILSGTDGMDGLTESYELFGKSGAQIYEAVKNGTIDFKNLGKQADISAGSVSDTFEATLDPIDKWKTTLNELKTVGAEVGGTLGDVLAPMIEKVGDFVKSLKEKWDSLSPETQEAIEKAVLIAAAVGPVITAIGGVVGAIGNIISIGGTLISMIGMLASPIGIVVAAIAAAIAIGVLLYKNWDEICAWAEQLKEKIVAAWNNVKESVTKAVDNMKTAVTNRWNAIKSTVSNAANNVKNAVSGAFNAVKSTITTAMDGAKNTVTTTWANMKAAFTEGGGGIKGAVSALKAGIESLWTGLFNTLDTITGGKLTAIYNAVKSKFDAVKNHIQNIVNTLKNIFNFKWELPKIKLPHFSWSMQDVGGIIQIPKISVQWYKKAYDQPYLFTQPTVMRGFGDGGGSGELVYGRDQLLRDIAQASGGGIDPNKIYEAVRAGASDATRNVYLNGRDLTRSLKSLGVSFNV